MKTFLSIVTALTLNWGNARAGQYQIGPTVGTQARDSFNASVMAQSAARNAALSTWRVVNGQTNNCAAPGWFIVTGTVLQNVKDGMMIEAGGETMFIAHAPFVPEKQRTSLYAKEVGTYNYITVAQAERVVRKLDFGIPVAAPAPLIAPPPPPLTPEQKEEQAQRVLTFQLKNASNGLPSFQYIIGQRYAAGDRLPRDLNAARMWLEKAAAQGDSEASAALKKLSPSLSISTSAK